MRNGVLSIAEITEIVGPIASRYGIQEIYLFGSYARGTATIESDLDFLVFGGEGFRLTLIFAFAEELREAFGKDVDVFEIHEVDPESAFYQEIMKEKLLVA